MKLKFLEWFIVSCLAALLFSSPVSALGISDLGTEITRNDGIASRGTQLGAAGEDDEVEHNSLLGQNWDLEGMFWNSTTATLSVVGGFNYDTGVTSHWTNYSVGDLFIGAQYDANGVYIDQSADYVLDLSRDYNGNLASSGTFETIAGPFDFVSTTSDHVPESNPWLYATGTGTNANIDGGYSVSLIDNQGYFSNWPYESGYKHYVLQLWGDDAAAFAELMLGSDLHMTLQCGNDTIRGTIAPVPEPDDVMILGSILLIGLTGLGRRRLFKP